MLNQYRERQGRPLACLEQTWRERIRIMKLAVIGGGSTYTPELADGIARLAGELDVSELVPADPDEGRLSVVGPFSARIMRAHGHPGRLTWTSRLEEALDGAGAVLVQLRIGGQAARQRDETWPLACGCIGQETTGAGGLAKALRTVPVVLDIAAYEELAVEAAVKGGRERVAAALLAHPLAGQYDLASQLTDRLLAENQAFLPWAAA